ncbi:hypothetical protein AB1484_30210 [Parafrankia sp. FMc6]|uniref:hypothetical protein n=1 Tax=Parafrankia soli TaxID=2599596 RepID=UPI0034D660B3
MSLDGMVFDVEALGKNVAAFGLPGTRDGVEAALPQVRAVTVPPGRGAGDGGVRGPEEKPNTADSATEPQAGRRTLHPQRVPGLAAPIWPAPTPAASAGSRPSTPPR